MRTKHPKLYGVPLSLLHRGKGHPSRGTQWIRSQILYCAHCYIQYMIHNNYIFCNCRTYKIIIFRIGATTERLYNLLVTIFLIQKNLLTYDLSAIMPENAFQGENSGEYGEVFRKMLVRTNPFFPLPMIIKCA